MIALFDAYKAGLFSSKHWVNNILSGAIVGIVALPLSIAFAIASGAKPEQGLYTAIIAGLAVAIFGGSRVQVAGPAGAFIALLAGITAQYGIEGLQIATFMAGFILLGLGFLRLGVVIKYIPDPVIVGFTAGIAVIIWVGQWKDFFGLNPESGKHFHEKLYHLIEAFPTLHWPTTALALFSLLILILSAKFLKRVPAPLIALIVATSLQAYFKFDGITTIGSTFGGIPNSLPLPKLPSLSFSLMLDLIGPAFAIAMLGAIESLLCAVVADGMTGQKHNSNQELIGQGIANLLVPLFGGFAATGTVARTATNIRNGATSPLSGIVHSITLILIMLLLAPIIKYVPMAVLAAILFVVAYNMSEMHRFAEIVKYAPRLDALILVITFLLTVFTDLVIAVIVGIVLAVFIFMQRMARSVRVEMQDIERLQREAEKETLAIPEGTIIYSIDGPFFFGAAELFEDTTATTHSDMKRVIIRLGRVPFIDATALQSLKEVVERFHNRNIEVVICEANENVAKRIRTIGIQKFLSGWEATLSLREVLQIIQEMKK